MEKLCKEIELAFWKAAIPLLTRSAALRNLVRSGTVVIKNKKLVNNLGILLVACCLGFAFGMLVFSVYSLVV